MSRVPPPYPPGYDAASLPDNVILFPGPAAPRLCCAGADFVPAFDRVAVVREFPALWSAWVGARFASTEGVARAFAVSPRAAGKWVAGEGCHGSRLLMAEIIEPGLVAHLAQTALRRVA